MLGFVVCAVEHRGGSEARISVNHPLEGRYVGSRKENRSTAKILNRWEKSEAKRDCDIVTRNYSLYQSRSVYAEMEEACGVSAAIDAGKGFVVTD